MLPLSSWPEAKRRSLVGVFTDIDDTLTTDGAITPDALQALADLKAACLRVIPITGRPIGWCRPFAQGDAEQGIAPWPVDAMVAENGAVAYASHAKDPGAPAEPTGQSSKIYQQDAATRAANLAHMQQVATQVLLTIPGVQLSNDNGGRETDLAFDYNEFASLPPQTVERVIALLQDAGMQTTTSSIHIHGCFGNFNKWQGACWIVRELLGRDLTQELDRWVFVGDSGNDETMFQHFPHSIGVANIRRFEAGLRHKPRYITAGERGAGFAEVARALLSP